MSADRYYEAVYNPETGTMVMRPKWRLNEPGYARAPGQRGELVVGISEYEAARLRDKKAKEQAA